MLNMQYQHYSHNPTVDKELRQLYLFTGLSDQELAKIKQSTRQIALEEGEVLFKQGQEAEHFFVVKEGHIKLIRLSIDGGEKVFEVISPGQTFGEAIMFMPEAIYPLTAQAINNSLLLGIENKALMEILKDSCETCFQLMSHMSKRLRMWINEIDQLTLQNATYRLINYLLYQIPEEHNNTYEINFQIPKQVIASRLSMKPETFSRILQCLNKEGLITVKGKMIEIPNIDRLRLYSVDMEEGTIGLPKLKCQ
jgi:CRP/FNR family transcriptional regulator, dissimilatory nitrate respiration regulator